MKHLKSINEIFGIFKKKDDDIAKGILDKIKSNSIETNAAGEPAIKIDQDSNRYTASNHIGGSSWKSYEFTIDDLPIMFKYSNSWSQGTQAGLGTNNTYYILNIDSVNMKCSKSICRKIQKELDNAIERPKKEEDDFIKKDIRNILSKK
jgi:hypothetical protein